MAQIKSELQTKVLQRARQLCSSRNTENAARADAGTATERPGAEWSLIDANAACLQCFAALPACVRFLARVVDHASAAPHSISGQIALMLQSAGVRTVADFSDTQAVDACGYIAADAVSRLREAALARENGWLDVALPDYSHTHCAVSYTHLRAHETREELVCRLLLEKKKPSKTKKT